MIFEDRIQVNPRLLRLLDPRTNETVDFEIQDLEPEEIIQEGTEIGAEELNGQIVNGHSESTSNVYSADYINGKFLKVFSVELTLGTFPAGGDKYDQVYAIPTTDIPSDYTPIAIAGTQLWGGYHSKVSFSYMYITERNIAWAANNNSSNATGSIGANVRVLAMKTS